jgi:hypothetical protein
MLLLLVLLLLRLRRLLRCHLKCAWKWICSTHVPTPPLPLPVLG